MSLARKRGALMSRLTPNNPIHRFELDQLGTFVVSQIDGQATVADIIERFVKRFKVNRREAELSVVDFLKTLSRKRITSIAVQ